MCSTWLHGASEVDHNRIRICFNTCFGASHNTLMQGGAAEPVYLPACEAAPATVCYREDFAASALHEAAHWCIAGPHRRTLEDFGYGYVPPPRSEAQQQRFFALECRNQALEKVFADCAGLPFRVSADDPGTPLAGFEAQVQRLGPETLSWLQTTAGERAKCFADALRGLRSG